MSQIIINEKNFERFSRRMRDLLNEFTGGQVDLGKLQSQEWFSQILGSENVHELRANLKKEKTPQDYTFKLNKSEVDAFFNQELTTEQEGQFINKMNLRMGYVCGRIADISGYELSDWTHAFKTSDTPSILNCILYKYHPEDKDFKQDMKESMGYTLEYTNKKIVHFDKYIRAFPTSWLFEEFENTLIDEVKTHHQQEMNKEDVREQLRHKFKR